MIARRLRHKILLAVGLMLLAVFGSIAYFYTNHQERLILEDYKRSLHTMTSSVVSGIESIMLENHAEIMPEYAKRLKAMPGLMEFVILRRDGSEAFRDDATISAVNTRLGGETFQPRTRAEPLQVMASDDAHLLAVKETGRETYFETSDEHGQRLQVLLDPIPIKAQCQRCHAGDHAVQGIIRVTSSLASIEAEVLRSRIHSIALISLSLILTTLVTGYILGRSVVGPIEALTKAMGRISGGELDQRVPLRGGREIRHMAESFNSMTAQLEEGYELMSREKDKLATVIRSAQEAIVVTDAAGGVVLINPAAEELLGKPAERIRSEGFQMLFDDPALMARLIVGQGTEGNSELVPWQGRSLLVTAAEIDDADGQRIGSAAQIRDVTEERRLLEELRHISITDALTGVFNRRHLDERLAAEFARASRYGTALSVLLFDVDHFKRFNDTYGHDQGDRVLQAMGQAMHAAMRPYDIPCRYGGEEFVVILPEADEQGAISVGERLRKRIEAMTVDGLKVTISLGAASFPKLAVNSPEALLEAADVALYRAKEGGRNRLSVAVASGG